MAAIADRAAKRLAISFTHPCSMVPFATQHFGHATERATIANTVYLLELVRREVNKKQLTARCTMIFRMQYLITNGHRWPETKAAVPTQNSAWSRMVRTTTAAQTERRREALAHTRRAAPQTQLRTSKSLWYGCIGCNKRDYTASVERRAQHGQQDHRRCEGSKTTSCCRVLPPQRYRDLKCDGIATQLQPAWSQQGDVCSNDRPHSSLVHTASTTNTALTRSSASHRTAGLL